MTLERDGQIVLSKDEEQRAARFRFDEDRARWIRAHSALRLILSDVAGIGPEQIRFAVGPHGKPSLEDGAGIEFSLSHSGSWAMVAVTRGGVPVGVDIERIRENVDMPALLNRLGVTDLSGTQSDLYQAWTRREARSKAAGGALFDAPAADFRVCDLKAPDGYSAALALIGANPRILPYNVGTAH